MTMQGLNAEESVRLNALWQVADRAGLHGCTSRLDSALLEYKDALDSKREIKAEVDQAQADRDDAANMARTVISRSVTREGTKTYVPDGENGEPRQVTADEAKAWVERTIAADDEVVAADKPLADARLRLEEATDRIALAERRILAARYSTDASVALTNLLATAFKETTR